MGKILRAVQTNYLGCWGFGLEVTVLVSEDEYVKIPETLKLFNVSPILIFVSLLVVISA